MCGERVRIALLPLLAACATGARARARTPRRRSGVDVARYGRLLAMADERRVDTALIRRSFASGSSPERAAAALAVGQVQARALAPTLRALLADRDTTVAGNAAYALGLLADTGAVDALAHALGAPPAVARNAAWALGQIGEPARARARRCALRQRSRGAIRACAARCCSRRSSSSRCPSKRLRPWLADQECARALGRGLRDRPTLRSLRGCACSSRSRQIPTPRCARRSRAHSRIVPRGTRSPSSYASRSQSCADDSSAHVRINALHSEASYGASRKKGAHCRRDARCRMPTCASLPPRRWAPCSTTRARHG